MFTYKNKAKQILTQVEKQQERNNMNNNYRCWTTTVFAYSCPSLHITAQLNNNNDNSNNNNENSFPNENNSQMLEKQLTFITLLYKGQQGEKVIKSFKTTLHRSLLTDLYIETKLVYTGRKPGSDFQIGKC